MRCRLFHDWGPWHRWGTLRVQDYQNGAAVNDWHQIGTVEERICLRCGKSKREDVK